MALTALGAVIVPMPGTPVQVISVQSDKTKRPSIHGIMVQTLPSNAGKIYIGINQQMNKSTLIGVAAVLAVPTINFLPTFSAAITISPNGLNLGDFWIDSDNVGEGVLVTTLTT